MIKLNRLFEASARQQYDDYLNQRNAVLNMAHPLQQSVGMGPIQTAAQNAAIQSAAMQSATMQNTNGRYTLGSSTVGGSGNVSSVFNTVPAAVESEYMMRKVSTLNKRPATAMPLKEAFTLFAARWGMEWVFIADQRPADIDEMDWRALAERLYRVDMAEKSDEYIYRLVERDHGNS